MEVKSASICLFLVLLLVQNPSSSAGFSICLSLLYIKEDQVDSQIDTPNPTIFFFSQKIRTAFSLLTGWKLGVSTGHASSVAWSTPNNIIPNTRIVGAKVQGKAFVTVSFVIDAVQSQNVSCKSLVVQLYKGDEWKELIIQGFAYLGSFGRIQRWSLVGMKSYQIWMNIYEYISCFFCIRYICFRNPSLSIWFLIVRMLNILIYKLCLDFEPLPNRDIWKYTSFFNPTHLHIFFSTFSFRDGSRLAHNVLYC